MPCLPQSPYDEGYNDWFHGEPNPYPRFSDESIKWEQGNYDAEEKHT